MNIRVEEFLKKKQLEATTELIRRQNLHLLELGLYDVEYASDNSFSEAYPDYENGKYCKKKPVEVTPKEYESICKVAPEKSPQAWPNWPVAKILFMFSIAIYVVGFTAGMVSGFKVLDYFVNGVASKEFLWTYLLTYWLAPSFFGSILLGLSEHLRLLDRISKKTI